MRKLATIFLLIVFSSSFTELGQLWKLPFLVQHFYSHQQQEDSSLGHFILEHYGSEHDDADKAEDMQLPFKTTLNSPSATALPGIPKIEISQVELPEVPRFVPLHTTFVPSLFAQQIFHPPRTVC